MTQLVLILLLTNPVNYVSKPHLRKQSHGDFKNITYLIAVSMEFKVRDF